MNCDVPFLPVLSNTLTCRNDLQRPVVAKARIQDQHTLLYKAPDTQLVQQAYLKKIIKY
jgi:hypothetical protein